MSSKYNILFFKLNHPESQNIANNVSSLPFKVVKICIDKVNPSKIPSFVKTVPLLKLQNGEILAGQKLTNWCTTFCKQGSSQNTKSSTSNNNNNQNNLNITGDDNISPIYSKEFGGFSDNYSFLTDEVDKNKVEQIKPIDHSFSFLNSTETFINPNETNLSENDNNKSNRLDDALNRFKMEREQDLKPIQRH